MTTTHRIFLAVTTLLLVLGLVRYCDRPVVTPTPPGTLAPNERERVEIHGRTVTHITKEKTTREFAPEGVKVSINNNGTLTLDIRKYGFTREFGVGYITTGDRVKPQLDMKFYFYHRAGVHGGVTFDTGAKKPLHDLKDFLHLSTFGSYTLPVLNDSLSVGAGFELFPNKCMGVVRYSFR